jgi:dGTP triphosphohydrolase
MSQLHSLAVNGVSYDLPTMNQFTSQLTELGRAMQSMGISAYDMTDAIKRMNEVLSRLEYHADEITAIKDSLHDLRYETENIQSGLDCRTAELEMELSDLRSAMDAKTENPKQKDDLEIFSQIEWDEHFLNFGPSNIFLN